MSSPGQPPRSSLQPPGGWEKRPLLARPKIHFAPARAVRIDIDGVRTAGIRFAVRPPSRPVSITLVVAGLGFVALGGTAAVLALRDGMATGIIGFVVLAGLGSIFLLGGLAGLRSSRTDLGVDLTESHVVVGLGFDRLAVPWDDIARIDATTLRYTGRLGMRGQVQHWLLIVGTPSSPLVRRRREHPRMLGRAVGWVTGDAVVAMPTGRLGSDPVVVFHALRHYLERPDERIHLRTGAAATAWSASTQPR
ncbi:hypothetical protein [Haloactinopolyspora sp.]|uniref:hypothetical protein n=1 Tax=Haloactinopolyspora sp. TaxID=1966353 RepID=UPI002601A1E8|nr:hypothetical protein [Haloactinopolyspora sp.]